MDSHIWAKVADLSHVSHIPSSNIIIVEKFSLALNYYIVIGLLNSIYVQSCNGWILVYKVVLLDKDDEYYYSLCVSWEKADLVFGAVNIKDIDSESWKKVIQCIIHPETLESPKLYAANNGKLISSLAFVRNYKHILAQGFHWVLI